MKAEDIKLLDFRNLKFEVKETTDGMYNIFYKEEKMLHKDVDYDEIKIKAKSFNRKIELIELEGFEEDSTVELANGFKRTTHLYNKIEGVDVYIHRDIDANNYIITAVKRYLGKDFISKAYAEYLYEITSDAIERIVKSVIDKCDEFEKIANI